MPIGSRPWRAARAGRGADLRILLIGGQGQLGLALRRSLAGLGTLSASIHAPIHVPTRAQCDLCDAASLQRCVRATQPGIIINAAACTDVDGAEDRPDVAMAVNARGPALLADLAHESGALLVHYCSDYVFDGRLGRPYVEADAANPVNAYGRSKLAGTCAVVQSKRHLILRAGWLYSAEGHNFLQTMVARLSAQQRVTVVADQIGAPTSAAQLAEVTTQLLVRYRRDPEQFPFGLYHVAAAGQTSWYGYACTIAKQMRAAGVPLAADAVQSVSSAQRPTRARRPLDTRLATTRLRDTFGITLAPWQDGVAQTLGCLLNPNRA